MRQLLVLSCALALAACDADTGDNNNNGGGGETSNGGGAQGGGENTGGENTGGGAQTQSFTVTFDPITVMPEFEDTMCVTKRLGNDTEIHVNQIENILPNGSHHLIVYRTADTEERLEPYACQPFADTLDPSKGSPIMVTQKHEETLTLPEGVAFTLQPGVMIRLEMHFLNAGTEPIEVSATSTFRTMDPADFEYEADFLFMGNPDINIGPMQSATLGPTFLRLPDTLAGSKFFGLTGHTHQWGTNVTVDLAESEDGPFTPVYDVAGWQWDEPETVYLDPPVDLTEGGGFRFSCEWNNLSTDTVGFGEDASDEMCFFWAYYYPSKGSLVCAHTDQVEGGFDICCPGNPFCDQLF